LTVTAVVFRAEMAIFLFSNIVVLILTQPLSISRVQATLRITVLPPLISGTIAGLALTVPLDTYFWRQSLSINDYVWPELSAFLSNIFPDSSSANPSGASAWGTSPWHWYFTSAIPRLLLNPVLLLLVLASFLPSLLPRTASYKALIAPSLLFTSLYSLLPHKETRFIFPIVPPLTTAAAIIATWISNRQDRYFSARTLTYIILISTLLSALIAHTILLPLSSLSYPGGAALSSLHTLSTTYAPVREIHVHLSNLALQTGVTRFQYLPPPSSPLVILRGSPDGAKPTLRSGGTRWFYDKSANSSGEYNEENWWRQFDYVVVEDVEDVRPVSGGWDVIDTVYSPGRPRIVGGEVGRGLLVLGQGEGRRYPDGIARVLGAMYGDGVLGRMAVWVYGVLHDVAREGYGLPVASLTGGRWVHWNMERKLFVMKRSPNLGSTRRYSPFRPPTEGERMEF
jgi:alpha-1,6-mannosyltransferase